MIDFVLLWYRLHCHGSGFLSAVKYDYSPVQSVGPNVYGSREPAGARGNAIAAHLFERSGFEGANKFWLQRFEELRFE